MTDVGGVRGPHSSPACLSGCCGTSYQALVRTEPSDADSIRNLFSTVESWREGGGIKSHGNTTKSRSIRCAKARRIDPVPNEESCGSPYVCRSMRREGKEAEASERTWSAIDLRCDVGQTRRTSVVRLRHLGSAPQTPYAGLLGRACDPRRLKPSQNIINHRLVANG